MPWIVFQIAGVAALLYALLCAVALVYPKAIFSKPPSERQRRVTISLLWTASLSGLITSLLSFHLVRGTACTILIWGGFLVWGAGRLWLRRYIAQTPREGPGPDERKKAILLFAVIGVGAAGFIIGFVCYSHRGEGSPSQERLEKLDRVRECPEWEDQVRKRTGLDPALLREAIAEGRHHGAALGEGERARLRGLGAEEFAQECVSARAAVLTSHSTETLENAKRQEFVLGFKMGLAEACGRPEPP